MDKIWLYILHEVVLKNKKKKCSCGLLHVLVTCNLGKDDSIMHEFCTKEKRKGEVVGKYVAKVWIVECMPQTQWYAFQWQNHLRTHFGYLCLVINQIMVNNIVGICTFEN